MQQPHLTRRTFNLLAIGAVGATLGGADEKCKAADSAPAAVDLAVVATPSASYVSGDQGMVALNAPSNPRNSRDHSHGAFGNWPSTGTQWVEYAWSRPICTNRTELYFFADGRGLRAPAAYRVQYWNGSSYVTISDTTGLGVNLNSYNATTFSEIKTDRLRIEFDSAGQFSVGILRWRVFDSGNTQPLPPLVTAGPDRIVVGSAKTYLAAKVRAIPAAQPTATWQKQSGPGDVTFANAQTPQTTATFSRPGEYKLIFTAGAGDVAASDSLRVRVDPATIRARLERIDVKPYKISSALWKDRIKALIVNWIPHCIAKLSDLNVPEGGINNFVQAGNKLAGRPFTRHTGYPWANAYLHNTVESACIALQVDPQGDADVSAAQQAMRAKIEEWIPILLAAQEPDGYLQTRFTLDPRRARHWTLKTEHEGYTAGYFIEAAIAHFILTNKTDSRLYDAAKRLADCWDNNIGPAPKKSWYDGHEELEQALIRLARLVNETEGNGKGDKYVALSQFLLSCRKNGDSYDQSHLPVVQQYEALGHAVRAVYLYKAMSDVANLTGDPEYQSAISSIWDNLVNRKYYVTGGVGSGDTSEGFGADYSLRNESYCESCAGCGEVFFQHSMSLGDANAKYADLYEQTLFNAVLGDVDLDGTHFTYTNSLDERGHRTLWHACPCCVGNIPRTLLQIPTWAYSRADDGLYVNLYFGSTVTIENVGGTAVEMVQETDYPWTGDVTITVNPAESATFTLRLRAPTRDVSTLYSAVPQANGIASLSINGESVTPQIENGYAVLTRQWKSGDRIQLQLPMPIQKVTASDKIPYDHGRVALRCGPLIYNVENIDQDVSQPLPTDAELKGEWRSDLLRGVRVITGKYADGSALLAIPNYARNNRGDERSHSIVWIQQT